MMRIAFAAALAVITMTTAGSAHAQARPVNPFDTARIHRGLDQLGEMIAEEIFRRYDTDRDGWLNQVEAAQAARTVTGANNPDPRAWRALDLDRDGRLSRLEMRAAIVAMRRRMAMGETPF